MERAFDEDTRIHLGEEKGGPEGYDNGSFLRKWGLHKDASSYCISMNGLFIGGVILWINEDNMKCYNKVVTEVANKIY